MATPFEYTANHGLHGKTRTSSTSGFVRNATLGLALFGLAGYGINRLEVSDFRRQLNSAPIVQTQYMADRPIQETIRRELPGDNRGDLAEKIQMYQNELQRLNPGVDFVKAYQAGRPIKVNARELDNYEGFGQ